MQTTALAIPRCSANSKLGSRVESREISPERGKPATQEGGPYGQAYGGEWELGRGESGKTRES
jgi:hypothetical protein